MNFSVIPIVNAILSIFSEHPLDLTCPTSLVTIDSLNRSFPSVGLAQFPQNYDCGIEFEIPVGHVVKFEIQAKVNDLEDKIVVRDSALAFHELSPNQSTLYVPANTAKLWIKTKSSSSSFHVTWEYIDITGFTKVEYPRVEVMPLNLSAHHYYLLESPYYRDHGVHVTLHTGSLQGDVDPTLESIFVYDGSNLTAKFVGTLGHWMAHNKTTESTEGSFTLVNFYGLPSDSYVMFQEVWMDPGSDVSKMVILSKDTVYRGREIATSNDVDVIIHVIDSNETYITGLNFKNTTSEGLFMVSRFERSTGVLVYRATEDEHRRVSRYNKPFVNESFPQLIPSHTFVLNLFECDLDFELYTGHLENYTQVATGRGGVLFSHPAFRPPASNGFTFFTNLTATEDVKFEFDVEELNIKSLEDGLGIEIGTGRSPPTKFKYKDTANPERAAVGRYMAVSFNGKTEESQFVLSYQVKKPSEIDNVENGAELELVSMAAHKSFEFSLLAILLYLIFMH